MPPLSALHDSSAQAVFDAVESQFTLTDDSLVELTKAFLAEFELGLANYGKPLAMIPTFVTGVPDGTETGTFLALDLGGTNLRVCEVVLKGDKTFTLVQQKYRVSDTLKTGEATALFDYLADSVDAFLTTHATTEYLSPIDGSHAKPIADIHLGLTFSFPVEQTALDSGKILTWTKGFSAKNAVGNDVVKLLQEAFDRKHMHVKCVALVNDTVGALLSRAYTSGGCLVGAIFGTGTNGAYIEDVSKIVKLKGSPAAAKGGDMIINCEWGAFNNSRSHLPNTPYDNNVDRLSINPGFQAFEKFISGMYLGEIVRLVLISFLDATPKRLIFNGKSSAVLNKHYGIDTSLMSAVEEAWIGTDSSPDAFVLPPLGSADFGAGNVSPKALPKLQKIQSLLVEHLKLDPADVSLRDAAVVRLVCALVARRAALLSGVAVATVLIQTNNAVLGGGTPSKNVNSKLGVGVDGSLIELYPNFEPILRESLRSLVGEDVEKRVDIGLAKDGSGVGAALCALVALKEAQAARQ